MLPFVSTNAPGDSICVDNEISTALQKIVSNHLLLLIILL